MISDTPAYQLLTSCSLTTATPSRQTGPHTDPTPNPTPNPHQPLVRGASYEIVSALSTSPRNWQCRVRLALTLTLTLAGSAGCASP
eukprot:scaffold384_cov30-Phaeocystis_antarctica.AAC.2